MQKITYQGFRIHICETPQEAGQEAAKIVLRILNTQEPEDRLRNCTFPTGNTPLPMYEYFRHLQSNGSSAVDALRGAKIFGLDEYLVGEEFIKPSEPQSYTRQIREAFIQPLGMSPENRVIFAGDPHSACTTIEDILGDSGGLDLAVLGLGHNGHLGFNEPISEFNSRTRVVKLDEDTRGRISDFPPDQKPTHAATLGLGTITDSSRIVLLVTGESKRDILTRALMGDVTENIPASVLQRFSEKVTLVIDKGACPVSFLQERKPPTGIVPIR
jgi:glucosamine-6-phosphate deaminase